ncbi:hypothetical protein OKW98_18500 [Pseudomonas sp. KU26590]|uniref:hypothetical protein n=1 Tax=Pseudomonas sp. KU26590 TaxID=2991051 RepID=UPI00223E57CD|nr:hypothetical protein [Pseudomonas sp. KU26590]UZJ58568.1 hypothetical protein OKW98_18500 [Pseudomonas sp. KU26590]
MSQLKVVTFEREGWRDAVRTLRKVAEQIESGELPLCDVGVLALIGDNGQLDVYGFGKRGDDLQCIGAMRLAEQRLIDTMLSAEDELIPAQ